MGNLRGYVNKVNNSNKIYTREDIGAMSQGDYAANEKAIDHQMQTVGVPTNKDLQNSSDVVYVSAYKRADGTEVKAYYRSKPDGIGAKNSSNNPPGDLVPNTNYGNYIDESIDKILGLFSGGYTGESIVPTDKNNPIDKLGNTTILAQILNLISGKETKGTDNENILQKILGGAKTNGTSGDIISNLLNVLSDGNIGDLGKVLAPDGKGGGWDEQIPSGKTEDPSSNIPELGNPLPAILDYINTGKIDLNKFLAIPKTDGGIIDENPWDGESGKEDKKSKKEEEKEKKEEEKINPLNDLLNYAFTGEFNKDVFISHVVDSYTNQASKYLGDSDPETKKLLKYIKDSNEQIDKILDSAVNLLPEDSQITNAVKGLVQYKKSMCEQMETMLDPEKRFKQQAEGLKQWLSNFTDFTGQLVSGDFQNIKWAEIGQELHISEMARAINPIAGIVATLAVDVAPKVIKLTEACNAGDKVEIIQNAIAAFTNCMSVIGELQEALSDKLAVVSKDVDAKIYNQATQTYQNLDKLQDAGYKYETYVKAEMFDQANQEAIKLNDLSTEMMQGEATGFASNINRSDLLTDLNNNDLANYTPSSTILKGGVSFFDDAIKNNPAIDKKILDAGIPITNTLSGNNLSDSKGLWDTASKNFQNTDYINKNADVVNSVSDFGNNTLSRQISNKLQSQFGIKDAKGLAFYPNSELTTKMSNSSEIKAFLDKNRDLLDKGYTIKNSSVSFNANKDLFYGIHNADILNAKINQNGDFQAIVLDTYDFNKNSTNPLVQMARSVQDAKKLTPYYTINFIYIPREKLLKH